MRFRILGPLSVTVDGREVAVTAARDRVVLAMLLSHPGRVVTVDALAEAVWGVDPPATARGQLQTCVSRLRRVLPPGVIGSDPAGYRIDPGPDDLDSIAFARLAAAGREGCDPALLRRGLDLWRGVALSGIDSPAVRRAAVTLDEQRATAMEDWAELELAAGRPRDLIGPLVDLIAHFPLRERLRAQLIRALAGSGQTVEALAEFRRFRAVLREELSIEPGRRLQELHRQILSGETVTAPVRVDPVRSLPRTVADFTGREEVIARMVKRAAEGGPVVLALDGMAGSGKTTVALHLAGELAGRYPDAHLYVDLRGHSDQAPLDPSAALLALLRRLGVGADQVPADPDERIDLWRSELAGRKALVILDNAASSAQVADLLPASPEVLVVVTSRRRLLGLDGVHPESLPVLGEWEALALLARIAGDRIRNEPAAATELVRRCGGLPLAIRLAGARLAHRPRWKVADLVERFGSAVLPELAAENRTVAGAFALSFGQLPEPAQRVFRLLGASPSRLFDAPAVAALADIPVDDDADLLDDLVDVHLIEEPERHVFRMHDLLHEYASALAAELRESDRHAAIGRMLDLELGATMATQGALREAVVRRELDLTEAPRPDLVAAVPDVDQRLERARPHLGALVAAAIEIGRPEFSWQLARAAWWNLAGAGYNEDIQALFSRARIEALRAGNDKAQAMCANYLASIYFRRARFDDAQALLQEAIRLRRTLGDPGPLATSLGNLTAIYAATDRFVEAAQVSGEALRLAERADDTYVLLMRLDVGSFVLSRLGRHDEALWLQRRRLMAVTGLNDRWQTVHCLMNLVMARRRAGRISLAAAERAGRVLLRHALRLKTLDLASETRDELAGVLTEAGQYAEAAELLTESLECYELSDDWRFRARSLNSLGIVTRLSGDRERAAALHREASRFAQTVSQPFEVARAHLGLGDCATDPETARRHWRTAEEIFTRLHLPERYEAAARLQEVDSQKEETGVSHCAI